MLNVRLSIAAAVLFARTADAQQPRDFTPYLIGDRAAEIALARSAAPATVSDSATVCYDRSLPASTWGAGGESPTVFDGLAGDTTAAVHVVLIPVRRWSDGSIVTQGTNRVK